MKAIRELSLAPLFIAGIWFIWLGELLRMARAARFLWELEKLAEIVSPGSETTDRIVKADQYARAGIALYWRIEPAATGVPLVYTYILGPATRVYQEGDVFAGVVEVSAPFVAKIDLMRI